jgi:hypothetical protein
MTAGAGQPALIRRRDVELQQLVQSGGSGLMEGSPQGTLDGLQIGESTVLPLGEDAAQQLVYLTRNFLMDCSSRFFP